MIMGVFCMIVENVHALVETPKNLWIRDRWILNRWLSKGLNQRFSLKTNDLPLLAMF